MPTRDRAAYMREYRASVRALKAQLAVGTVTLVDIPVVDGIATLPDGRTVASRSQIVRVPMVSNLPEPPPYVEPEQRIAELEAEVERLTNELSRVSRPIAPGFNTRPFTPVPKPGK